MFAMTHKRKFNLVLNVFYMYRNTFGLTAGEIVNHHLGELSYNFAHSRAGNADFSLCSKERFGQCYGNFGGIKWRYGTVAS
jgi:hypothetical protein